ncbi:hypothetical protein BZL29_8165 [Mycobacterium kansasii]|uniref:Uncharacterized protein n=1 Tax=Mycobacterium kansasii TaxID=1768 RepID=A0A1V3WEN6_MYCKA|nr:hypothetical protein BZL29_8165 [Mycobacterium kansasii]
MATVESFGQGRPGAPAGLPPTPQTSNRLTRPATGQPYGIAVRMVGG